MRKSLLLSACCLAGSIGAAEFNAALGCPVSGPGSLVPESSERNLTDGRFDLASRWLSPSRSTEVQLLLTLPEPTVLTGINLFPDWREKRFRYRISPPEFRVGNQPFQTVVGAVSDEAGRFKLSKPIIAGEVRFTLTKPEDGIFRVYEIELLSPGDELEPEPNPLPSGREFDLNNKSEKYDLADGDWRFRTGDDPRWKRAEFDHAGWQKIEIGRPFSEQGFPVNFGWYRLAFELPETWAGKAARLDLGPISFYDRTYINGIPVGSTGNAPPEAPLRGSSFLPRGYLIPAGILKAGKNTLAIRCYPGIHAGLYTRRAQLALDETPLVEFAPPESFREEGLRLLCANDYRNEYTSGDPVKLKLELLAAVTGVYDLSVKVGEGKIMESLALEAGKQTSSSLLTLPDLPPGVFPVTVRLAHRASENATQVNTTLTILPPLAERISVNPDLDFSACTEPLPAGVGRFGGNQITEDGTIIDDFSIGNAEGNGVTGVLLRNDLPGVLLFLAGVRPSPSTPEEIAFYWNQPDNARLIEGRSGIWGLGMVTLPHRGFPTSIQTTGRDWSGKSWNIVYPDGSSLAARLSVASPGILFETGNNRIRLFDDIGRFGVAPPKRVLLPDGKTLTLNDEQELPLSPTENWILFSSAGAPGWTEFDLPQLLTFSHRPNAIRRTATGIELSFPGPVGRFWLTPLEGCNITSLAEAESWTVQLPQKIAERCRMLSRMMLAYPIRITERFALRPESDAVDFAIVPEFLTTSDQWETTPLQLVPLPGALGIALESGYPAEVNAPVVDLKYPTGNGPFLALPGPAVYRINHSLSPITTIRTVSGGNDPKALTVFRSEYRRLRSSCPLEHHPWLKLRNSAKATAPRTAFPLMNELMQGAIYLDAGERDELAGHFCDELRQVFLNPSYWPRYRFAGGPSFRCSPEGRERIGIDESCWAGAHLYLLSEGFRVFGAGRDAVKPADLPLIRELHALLYATMDFSACTSWDSFAGIRLGNGIQEVNFFYVGQLAAARIYLTSGEQPDAQRAAALAARQSLGGYAQFRGNAWARRARNQCNYARARTEYYEKRYAWRVAEHNEFCGMQQETFGNDGSLYTLLLCPIPETLEFYRRYAKNETRYYLEHQLAGVTERPFWATSEKVEPNHAINFADLQLYILDASEERVRQEFEAERKIRYPLFSDLSNARAVLDASGVITWKTLQEK